MELQTFQEDKKEKNMLDKILRIFIIGFLVMIVILMVDATGTLAQIYEREYGEWPDSWILKPIAEWYEDRYGETDALESKSNYR